LCPGKKKKSCILNNIAPCLFHLHFGYIQRIVIPSLHVLKFYWKESQLFFKKKSTFILLFNFIYNLIWEVIGRIESRLIF
jgi:hypothetical protein